MEAMALIDACGRTTVSGHLSAVPWWSFTKTVLAAAALRLAEQGLLSLHDKVAGEPYTLAQLLRHEAGLPDYGSLRQYHADVAAGKKPWPVAQLLEATEAQRLRYEPGRGWAYSNIGYLKVRTLIENAAGVPLGDALQALVFAPSGLTTARLATRPEDMDGVAMGGGNAGYHPGWVYHGLVVGTAADAARLLKALTGGDLLRPDSYAAMLEGRALPEYRSKTFEDPAYGLGLMLHATAPRAHPIGHRGGGPGSTIAVYAHGQSACALWQAPAPNSDLVVDTVFRHLRPPAQRPQPN